MRWRISNLGQGLLQPWTTSISLCDIFNPILVFHRPLVRPQYWHPPLIWSTVYNLGVFFYFCCFRLVVYGVFLWLCFCRFCLIFLTLFWSLSSHLVFLWLFLLVLSCRTRLYYGPTYNHIIPGNTWEPPRHVHCTRTSYRSTYCMVSIELLN